MIYRPKNSFFQDMYCFSARKTHTKGYHNMGTITSNSVIMSFRSTTGTAVAAFAAVNVILGKVFRCLNKNLQDKSKIFSINIFILI